MGVKIIIFVGWKTYWYDNLLVVWGVRVLLGSKQKGPESLHLSVAEVLYTLFNYASTRLDTPFVVNSSSTNPRLTSNIKGFKLNVAISNERDLVQICEVEIVFQTTSYSKKVKNKWWMWWWWSNWTRPNTYCTKYSYYCGWRISVEKLVWAILIF